MKVRKNRRGNTKVIFTQAEQEAMNREIEDQLLDFVGRNLLEIEALVLVQLREQLGFGKKRLKRFYNGFSPTIYDLMVKRLADQRSEQIYTCTKKLEDYGCNLEDWAVAREELLRLRELMDRKLELLDDNREAKREASKKTFEAFTDAIY